MIRLPEKEAGDYARAEVTPTTADSLCAPSLSNSRTSAPKCNRRAAMSRTVERLAPKNGADRQKRHRRRGSATD
jgi:hypothetical protein